MELFKSYLRQTTDKLNNNFKGMAHIYFDDFAIIEFEKYLTLKGKRSEKRTWFMRLDFRREERSARYLFFFGFPYYDFHNQVDVTLHVAREEPPGSFNYTHLSEITAPNVPDFVEIGYLPSKEKLLVRRKDGSVVEKSMESFTMEIFDGIRKNHFDS